MKGQWVSWVYWGGVQETGCSGSFLNLFMPAVLHHTGALSRFNPCLGAEILFLMAGQV
jgi:hypothetical protein